MTGTRQAPAIALLAALLLSPAGPLSPVASAQPSASELLPLPDPVLDGMDSAVREQLASHREAALTLAAEPDADAAELASRYGTLGGLYLIYTLRNVALPALANARALAPGDFQWAYLLGFAQQGEGDLEAAIASYRQALELQPKYLAARLRLGEALLNQAQPDEAAAVFEQALADHPNAAAAHFGRGRAAAARGDFAAAVADYERALEIQPGAAAVRYPLALAYRELGRVDEAERQLATYSEQGSQQVGASDPVIERLRGLATGSSVHFQRGRRALVAGDLATAEREFRQAVDSDPESAAARRALGLTLRQKGDIGGSVEQYTAAIELEPGNPLNYKDIALALADGGDLERSARAAARAIEIDPDFADAHLIYGIALNRLGRPDLALQSLTRAVESAPTDPAPQIERALTLAALGREDEAWAGLRRVLEGAPDNTLARVNLGALLELAGEAESARRELTRALEGDLPSLQAARAHLSLGRIEERGGDFSAARERYARAAVLDPGLAPAKLRLASVQARTGDLAAAATAYAEALELAPRHRLGHLAHASARIQSGDLAGARTALEAGLAATPGDPVTRAALALLLATAPASEVRDGERAVELAGSAYADAPSALFGQVFAAALAEAGRWDEALRAQRRIVDALESGVQDAGGAIGGVAADALEVARARLALYEQNRPLREPWRDDPALLPPAWLPPPAEGSDE